MISAVEEVVLVNEANEVIGRMEKLEAHAKAKLHRAFSVFIFNSKGELLLQQRAFEKYHSPGLWTNSCCSHPRPEEDLNEAVQRKLLQELGMQCPVQFVDTFIYRAEFENGLTEHELDAIFVGSFDADLSANPEEVENVAWVSAMELNEWMKMAPEDFTVWFKIILEKFPIERLRDLALEA